MWDSAVEIIGLAMKTDSLESFQRFQLPEQYGRRFYQPGDEIHWAEMWVSAGGFGSIEEALKTFHNDFPDTEPLKQRMIFLTDGGKPFATATVWFGDEPGQGRLHWVCVDAQHQERGLSRILISMAMEHCRELGYTSACLLTQTPCWVAIRMYHRFGFYPQIREERDRDGWKIVSEKSGIDFLSGETV